MPVLEFAGGGDAAVYVSSGSKNGSLPYSRRGRRAGGGSGARLRPRPGLPGHPLRRRIKEIRDRAGRKVRRPCFGAESEKSLSVKRRGRRPGGCVGCPHRRAVPLSVHSRCCLADDARSPGAGISAAVPAHRHRPHCRPQPDRRPQRPVPRVTERLRGRARQPVTDSEAGTRMSAMAARTRCGASRLPRRSVRRRPTERGGRPAAALIRCLPCRMLSSPF